MKKIFKKFWITQGCQETPLKMSKTPIFRVAQIFLNIFFLMVIILFNPIEVKIFE